MTDEVRVNHKNDRVEAATGEPSGSPETPSTGPLRGQAAARPARSARQTAIGASSAASRRTPSRISSGETKL